MKSLLSLTCAGLVAVSLLLAQEPRSQVASGTVSHDADLIERILPRGWTLHAEKSGLKVVRDDPVEGYNPSRIPDNLQRADPKANGFVQRSQYIITLEFAPPIAEAEVNRMRAENGKTRHNLDVLNNEIDALQEKHSPFMEGWRGHAPRSDKEQQLRVEYDTLKASLHRIPTFTTTDASIFMSQSVGTFTLFYSFEVEQECRHVWQAVEAVFVHRSIPAERLPRH